MKIIRLDKKTQEQEEFEVSEKLLKTFGPRTAFCYTIFIYQPTGSTFSEWINALSKGNTEAILEMEAYRDLCMRTTSSDGWLYYSNDYYSWTSKPE